MIWHMALNDWPFICNTFNLSRGRSFYWGDVYCSFLMRRDKVSVCGDNTALTVSFTIVTTGRQTRSWTEMPKCAEKWPTFMMGFLCQ